MSPNKNLLGKKNNIKPTEEYPLPPSCSVSNLTEFLADGNASFLRAARSGNLEKIIEFLKGNIDINTSNANGLNALHLAAKEGHVNVVTELVKRGANVNAATKKGNTALHIASLAGQEEVAKVLIQLGANVNVQSQNGFTPLYMAAQENHDTVVSFLLANGANQSLATEDGFTPLAVALQQGHDKVVAVLLENDTKGKVRLPALHIAAKKDDCKAATLLLQSDHNPDVTSKSGFTPLHIAAHYGNENIAKILLSKGADVNYSAKHQITPLHVASKWGKTNMVVLLLEKGANIEAATRDGLTPLHCAARSGHEQVVDMLLEKGAPILAKTKNGLAPLHMASQGDHVDSARILLYHKAPVDDVTVDYLTALHVAAHCGHVKVAKLLLDRKADANARALNGFTPLHIACKKNRIKVVELLLKHGASIEATTESGLTPLHVASFMGCMNIVIYLIQNGANPDVPTVRGETPLHLAARANQTDIIRILLRNGASVDARAREEQTPLHIAARLGNVDIVSLLLQHGAAVDAVTKDLYTALHIAAKEDQEEVASALLEHGASLTATTKKGFTPLHLAAKYGNIKVARLLLSKSAPVDAQGKNGVTPLHVAAHYDHVNVALLLLDKGASPHAMAKNGYTPLHIAAKKNQMDIASTLLEYGANTNSESKAGFTPLHLSSQEGHGDMSSLLIEHKANVNQKANNGLTPLHLCAQDDRVNVASVLVKNGAEINPQTKAGYTPLHVASHFGQLNMVRFLLQHSANVDTITSHGYTPLHQAAQQGHTVVVNLLLENQASPNVTTAQGQTPLSIAQRLGYISVVETLKVVTETTIVTTTTTVTEEKYKVVAPETMQETFMTDSEDEGGEEAMLGDQSYRYLTADEMKSLGDDSLPIDVTKDEKQHEAIHAVKQFGAPMVEEDGISPQHGTPVEIGFSEKFSPDNIDLAKAPVHAGFLVSFMVDARGGAMRGCRHSGVRIIIPPRKASMPMRITCRYLRKEKLIHPPPLMEGEACASRILEMGPVGARFLGPVIIEVPHFASARGKEREITILRSDTGETWREHTLEASEEAVQEVLNESFEGEELSALEDLNTNRITRILTTDFPQYFAIVSRIRQEVHGVGPEGGMVSSTVVPQVQAIFPEGALTKKIRVGLQAQPIAPELVAKLLGNRVAVSPIVTVEPRRRKFHKPITLTIPVPQAATKGMINQYSGDAPTLRLLCSITGSTKSGGSSKAQWEDVTGSTPLTFVNDCVSFTTTVSARFWLMDCRQVNEVTRFATELYQEAVYVPFMSKFVIFAKRYDPFEAQLRVFCMTDDKEDKTLESQEHFIEVAKSRDVEVLEGKTQYLEFAGNLVPVTKSGEQLKFTFQAFHENRLPFVIRVKDPHAEPMGRIAFMKEPKAGRGEPPLTPICNLNVALPDITVTEDNADVLELVTLEKRYDFIQEAGLSKPELIHRADLRLSDIARELDKDWVFLARQLDISEQDIEHINAQTMCEPPEQARMMLRVWIQKFGSKATGNELEKGLRKINREDIIKNCMFNVELVTDDVEKAVAKVHLDQSGFDVFKEELGSSREASMRRGASLDVSYDEQDIMKEAESAAETSSETGSLFDRDQISQALTDEKDGFIKCSVHVTDLESVHKNRNYISGIDRNIENDGNRLISSFSKNDDVYPDAHDAKLDSQSHDSLLVLEYSNKQHQFWPPDKIIAHPADILSTNNIKNIAGNIMYEKQPEKPSNIFEIDNSMNIEVETLHDFEKNPSEQLRDHSKELIMKDSIFFGNKDNDYVINNSQNTDIITESSVRDLNNLCNLTESQSLISETNNEGISDDNILRNLTENQSLISETNNESISDDNILCNLTENQCAVSEIHITDISDNIDSIMFQNEVQLCNSLSSEAVKNFEKTKSDLSTPDLLMENVKPSDIVTAERSIKSPDFGYYSLEKDPNCLVATSVSDDNNDFLHSEAKLINTAIGENEWTENVIETTATNWTDKNALLTQTLTDNLSLPIGIINESSYTPQKNKGAFEVAEIISSKNNTTLDYANEIGSTPVGSSIVVEEEISETEECWNFKDAKIRRASKTPPPSPIGETIVKEGAEIEKLKEVSSKLIPEEKERKVETEIKAIEVTVEDAAMHPEQEVPAKLTESETWLSGELDTSQVSVSSLPDDEKSEPTTATVSSAAAVSIDTSKQSMPDTEKTEMDESGTVTHIIKKTTHMTINTCSKSDATLEGDAPSKDIQETIQSAENEASDVSRPVQSLDFNKTDAVHTVSMEIKEITEHVVRTELAASEICMPPEEDAPKPKDYVCDKETDGDLTPCAFVNTAFAGAEVIDEVEQTAPIRARSPYEVIRGEDDHDGEAQREMTDTLGTYEKHTVVKHVEVRRRPILQHIPSEISEEDLVEREIMSPVSKEDACASGGITYPLSKEDISTSGGITPPVSKEDVSTPGGTARDESKVESSEVVLQRLLDRDESVDSEADARVSSRAEFKVASESTQSETVKAEEMLLKTEDATTPESDTGLPTSPFELASESEMTDAAQRSAAFPASQSLPKEDKSEDSVIMTTASQSVTEKTISVSVAASCKDASESMTLADADVYKETSTAVKATGETELLTNGPGEVEYDEEYDYDYEPTKLENAEKLAYYDPTKSTEVDDARKSRFSSVSDDVVDMEIRDILNSDQQLDDIIERPCTPEPPPDALDLEFPRGLDEERGGKDVFDYGLEENLHLSPSTPDSKSGFAYGMQFEKDILDQSEEAMDIDSDQCSEEREVSFSYGMRFERDPDMDDEDIPCYGDLYTHEEEDEESLENGEKPKSFQEAVRESEFDMLAGRKYFSKNVDSDELSMSSLQEFERLEAEIVSGRKSSVGSVDSLNGKQAVSKSGEHDDVSMSSLTEFERIEKECIEVEKIDPSMQESITQLSEIEEGHESQASETSQEKKSEADKEDVSVIEEYDDQLDNIDDIILKVEGKADDELPFQYMIKQAQKIERDELNEAIENVQLKNIKTDDDDLKKSSNWTKSKSLETSSIGKDDLDQDSLKDEMSIKPDSLIDDRQDFQDSLRDERFGDVDSLQEENIDEMHDSLFEERHIEDDSLHEMDILPDESSLSLEGSLPVATTQDTSAMTLAHLESTDNTQILPQNVITIESSRGDGRTEVIVSDIQKGADVMQSSTDSLEQSSSAAMAAFHIESESLMSSSLNSAVTSEDYTMISSTDTLEPEGRIMYRYEDIPVDDIEMLIKSGRRVIVDSEGNIQTHCDVQDITDSKTITNGTLKFLTSETAQVTLPPTAVEVHSALTTVKYIQDEPSHQKPKAFESSDDYKKYDSSYESSQSEPDVEVEEIHTTDEFGNPKIIRKTRKTIQRHAQFSSSSSSKDVEEKMKEFLREQAATETAGEEELQEERRVDEKGNVVIIRTVKQHIITEPEVHSRTFTGPEAEILSTEYVERFKSLDPTEDINEYERVDEQGNVVRVTQQFVVTPQVHSVSFTGPGAREKMEAYMKRMEAQSQSGEFQRRIFTTTEISKDTSENQVQRMDEGKTSTLLMSSLCEGSAIQESSVTSSATLDSERKESSDFKDEASSSLPK